MFTQKCLVRITDQSLMNKTIKRLEQIGYKKISNFDEMVIDGPRYVLTGHVYYRLYSHKEHIPINVDIPYYNTYNCYNNIKLFLGLCAISDDINCGTYFKVNKSMPIRMADGDYNLFHEDDLIRYDMVDIDEILNNKDCTSENLISKANFNDIINAFI